MFGLAPTESRENLTANESSNIKIASYVCGLRSKLLFPEFVSKIRQYDVIGFQETKTDDLDDIILEDYNVCFKNRQHISKHKSGGLALMYKKYLRSFVKILDSDSE